MLKEYPLFNKPNLANLIAMSSQIKLESAKLSVPIKRNENIFYCDKDKVRDKGNIVNPLLIELISVTGTNQGKVGFSNGISLDSLNYGFSKMAANHMEPCETDLSEYDEVTIVNLLSNITDFEDIKKAYFENNPRLMIANLLKVEPNIEKIKTLLDTIEQNYVARKTGVPSRLGEIENMLSSIFMKKPNLKEEQIEYFRNNLIGNSAMYEDKAALYKSVDGVYNYFDSLSEEYQIKGEKTI